MRSYEWDRKYWDTRRQKVLNKLARANVCYGKECREPNYENKQGTIIGFEKSPLVGNLLQIVEILMKDEYLIVEGNQYDDVKKKRYWSSWRYRKSLCILLKSGCIDADEIWNVLEL